MTKRMEKAYTSYKMSDKLNLYHAYTSFSKAKADAWEYCKELCEKKNGRGLKVIGANSSFFSAGFTFDEDGYHKFMYITHGGDYEAVIGRTSDKVAI